MTSALLRQQGNAEDHEYGNNCRGSKPAQVEAVLSARLRQEVTHVRAQGPGQNERRPEEYGAADLGEEVEQRDDRDEP